MPVDIVMPPLSQTMDSLVLVEWARQVGESVTKGEPLFVVETDKATLEVESPATGILQEVLAAPGSEVRVRAKIGTILAPGEVPAAAPPHPPAPGADAAPARAATGAPPDRPAAGPSGAAALPVERQQRVLASPRARRLAREQNVDLDQVPATGPRGMIVSRDVQAHIAARQAQPRVTPLARRIAADTGVDLAALAEAHPGQRIMADDVQTAAGERPAAAPADVVPARPAARRVTLSNLRRTIARRMQASHQITAPVTLTREVDATELQRLREQLLAELAPGDVQLTYTDLLAKVVARCLTRHPDFNGTFDGETLELSPEVHLALAVDTDRGLVVPVLRSAERKGLLELAAERAELVRRATAGSITPDQLAGGTFTLTNLGSLGVDAFTPIINPPQIAILGVGRIRPVPAVYGGSVTVRQSMYLSLTFDHRVVDGAPAARFLADIARLIEKPHLVWL